VARHEKRQALIEAGMLDPDDEDPMLEELKPRIDERKEDANVKPEPPQLDIPDHLTPELLALPGMKEALLRKAGIIPESDKAKAVGGGEDDNLLDPSLGRAVKLSDTHWLQELDINDYPREARWKVTQRETTSRLQDEFRTAVTLKGSYFAPGKVPSGTERRLYLHLESTSERNIQNCVLEIHRLLNEETLRVSVKGVGGHKYNVL
jgi:ATP-dependent RNA helicase DDX46/PRP5